IGVDVIEVGYPGAFPKDFDELVSVSQQIRNSIVCGLAGSHQKEIRTVASAIKSAKKGRIHIYTPVNLKHQSQWSEVQTLEIIQDSISLARNYCADVEWSAFDAARSEHNFLCKAVEVAIKSGATTLSIPDSLGTLSPEEFSELIAKIVNQVPNIEQATLSVHCHDDLGLAVENSLVALDDGTRQIECSVNGLGARKGNADLGEIVSRINQNPKYHVNINTNLLPVASQLVTEVTGIKRSQASI
ncbi:MAG TPA: 2-isopropylmalate synthase, partial [Cyanophyceae cyanobacterium]